jgi:dTDP-4-dehydrorhamnose 3,5-epimerase
LIFTPTPLPGTFVIDLERREDDRGFFARSYCQREFAEQGLNPNIAQCNVSFNAKRATLRGMHFQAPPHAEAKVVRCTQGTVWDVVLDLRAQSPTFKRWHGVELSAANRRALYIPEGVAHGFQTLTDDSELLYLMSEFYEPAAARGVRWDDPAFKIAWPLADGRISERDRSFPLFHG